MSVSITTQHRNMNESLTWIIALSIFCFPWLYKIYTLIFNKNNLTKFEFITIVTTLGVWFTFLGIFIGLKDFDVNNIAGSVPKLLEGLKTAFLTSLAGMLAGLLLKIWPKLYGIHETSEKKPIKFDTSTKSITDFINEVYTLLSKIERSVAGNDENTLFTQHQKIVDNLENTSNKTREQLELLNTNLSKIIEDGQVQNEVLKRIEKSIIGDEEISIFTQQRKLRDALLETKKDILQSLNTSNDLLSNNLKNEYMILQRIEKLIAGDGVETLFTQQRKILNTLDVTIKDITERLSNINSVLVNNYTNEFKILQNIERSVSGDGIETIFSQQREIQNTLSESAKQITESLNTIFNILNENLKIIFKVIQNIEKSIGDNEENTLLKVQQKIESILTETKKEISRSVDEINNSMNNNYQSEIRILQNIEKSVSKDGENTLIELQEKIQQTFIETKEDITKNIKAIYSAIQNAHKEDNEILQKIERSIVSDVEGSLYKQIQNIRSETNDLKQSLIRSIDAINSEINKKLNEQIQEFREFARNMAENNKKALFEALTEIIKDFNNKLNEKLTKSIDKFNESILKVLDWQEKNIVYVEQIYNTLSKSIISIQTSQEALEKIVKSQNTFNQLAENLEEVLTSLNREREKLSNSVEKVIEIIDKTKLLIPNIQNEITKLTNQLMSQISNAFNNIDNFVKSQNETLKGTSQELISSSERLSKAVNDSLNQISGQVQEMIKQSTIKITNNFAEFDKQLKHELEKSLTTLGNQLVSLSNKFVSDYSPLTDKLRKILTIAEKIELNEKQL